MPSLYFIYLFAGLLASLFMGHSLYKHGYYWLEALFRNQLFAINLNKLLLLGYYLLTLGYTIASIQALDNRADFQTGFESLTSLLGLLYLGLGTIHFCNLILIRLLAKKFQPPYVNKHF